MGGAGLSYLSATRIRSRGHYPAVVQYAYRPVGCGATVACLATLRGMKCAFIPCVKFHLSLVCLPMALLRGTETLQFAALGSLFPLPLLQTLGAVVERLKWLWFLTVGPYPLGMQSGCFPNSRFAQLAVFECAYCAAPLPFPCDRKTRRKETQGCCLFFFNLLE